MNANLSKHGNICPALAEGQFDDVGQMGNFDGWPWFECRDCQESL